MKNSPFKFWIRFLIPFLVLICWLLFTSSSNHNAIVIPSVESVFEVFQNIILSSKLYLDLGYTLLRTVVGFSVGVSVGVLLGIAMGSWRLWHAAMIFFVDSCRSIPATVLFPIFMVLLGYGFGSMILLIAFPCCWLVTVNTMYGVLHSSSLRKDMAKLFELSPFQVFWHVTFPDAMPSIVASLRLSIAICLHMALIGEMFMGTTSGLGYRVFNAHMLLNIPEMYAIIIIIAILGYLINCVSIIIENKLFYWRESYD